MAQAQETKEKKEKKNSPEAKYLEAAYKEAIAYADSLIDQCDGLKTDYKDNDAFLVKKNALYIVMMVLQIAAGIAGFFVKGMLLDFIDAHAPASWDAGLLENYVSMLLLLICIVLIGLGVWRLFRLIYDGKRKGDLVDFDKIAEGIKKEKEAVKEEFDELVEAYETKHFVKVENANAWEASYSAFRDKSKGMGQKTGVGVQAVSALISILALLIFGSIFTSWILTAVTSKFQYSSAFIICSVYLFLYELINICMVELARYQKKTAKGIMIGLFVIYQALICVLLIQKGAFEPALESGGAAIQAIITKGSVFMVFTTLFGVLIQLCTNLDQYLTWQENGFMEITVGGDVVKKIHKSEKYGIMLVGAICLLITPFVTAYLFNGGNVFLGILMYLVIGVAWIGMLILFSTERMRFAAGDSFAWTRNAFFAAYFFTAVSLVENKTLFAVLLIAVQVLAPIGLVALLSLVLELIKKQAAAKMAAPVTEKTEEKPGDKAEEKKPAKIEKMK